MGILVILTLIFLICSGSSEHVLEEWIDVDLENPIHSENMMVYARRSLYMVNLLADHANKGKASSTYNLLPTKVVSSKILEDKKLIELIIHYQPSDCNVFELAEYEIDKNFCLHGKMNDESEVVIYKLQLHLPTFAHNYSWFKMMRVNNP